MSFTKKIIVSMILGILIGVTFNLTSLIESSLGTYVTNLLDLVSYLFLSSLKLIIVPLIFFSIVCGIVSLSDDVSISRLGIKTLLLYTITTVIAISLGLLFSSFINYEPIEMKNLDSVINIENIETDGNIFPNNIFKSLSDGNIIHLLIFAVLIGISAARIKNRIKTFIQYFYDFNDVINELVKLIISFTPIAVFCILAKTFSTQGIETIMSLAGYFFTVVFVLLFHFLFTFSILIKLFTALNPVKFFQNLKDVVIFTFSTSSSSASIPFTLKAAEEKYGIDKSIGTFTVPLGATINMDGTAIMQGCATFFLASLYGIDLGINEIITIVITATIASIGTAGIPSAGIIMLTVIFTQIGIPLEGITLLLGVDRLLDMMRTSVNVSGDLCISCIIASSENKINEEVFNSRTL
ncbi:MAG: proton/glutamate symporter [Ectothiorhodospiraceae bacterium]|nr:MAG: proton/glutamate symporter [Ectothiorhodospiraceae bacterium]